MTAPAKSSDHWMVRMNHRNRTWCAAMMFLTVGSHLLDRGYGTFGWAALAFQFLLYPHLAYWRAHVSRQPRKAEMDNMRLDAVWFGIWAGALGFPIWITFIFMVSVTVNLTVFLGRGGFAQSFACALAGALIQWPFGGWHFAPETGWPTTALSIVTISLYVLVVAQAAYQRAIKLHEAREKLKQGELSLKRQLDEINALQAQLQEQAHRDPLTGLYNRRYFDLTLERELARCRREQQPLSVAMIDVDHFKQINDNYGHQAGDEVLRVLAVLLGSQVRASDVACRFGGEEFLVLLPGVGLETALARAEEWRRAFGAQAVRSGEHVIHATISAGIATCPDHCGDEDELIRRADLALYAAKSAGRNRVASASEVTAEAQ